MNKLTIEVEYEREAFCGGDGAICTVTIKREDGSMLVKQNILSSGHLGPLDVAVAAINGVNSKAEFRIL